MANPTWGEVLASTLAHRRKAIADAISKNNILLYELRRRGRIRTIGGGYTILTPIMVGDENANFQWYTGRDALNVAGQEVLTDAEVPWKQYAVAVSMSGLEMLQNSGSEQIINQMRARMQHAEKTIQNQLHKSAHGDGTGSGGKEMGGMQLMISSAAGSTYGGINSGTYTWWDNQRVATGSAPDKDTAYEDMLALYMKLQRGTDKPNLIYSDNTWYTAYATGIQQQQRFMDKKLAAAGFDNLMFHTTPVVFDGGMGGYAPAAMRFLNLGTIEMIMHKNRNNVVLGGPKRPLTEDSETSILAGMGNFICNNRMLNGVLSQ
ncbi:MAG: phage major capsid protein [Proteobacteria bacterium]|nr:phage major capsid protein [Pseudomonadota bacterium]